MNLRKFYLLFFVLILFGIFSCSTFNKSLIMSTKKAAVISVYCDKNVRAPEFKGLASALNSLANNKDFDLSDISIKLKNDIFNKYIKILGMDVLEEDKLINSEVYKTINDVKGIKLKVNKLFFTTPPNYMAISPMEKGKIKKILNSFPDVDAGIILYSYYALEKKGISVMGFGKARVKAEIWFYIINKEGKTILYKYVDGYSNKSISFALGGVFNTSEVQGLCKEATDNASIKLQIWMEKNLAKE